MNNQAFTLETLLSMKEELISVRSQIHLIETTRIVDRNLYYKLKQAEECYREYFKGF